MKRAILCVSSILFFVMAGYGKAQALQQGTHTYLDGSKASWYSKGAVRVDVITDRNGRLKKMVVGVRKYETDAKGRKRLVGFEYVTLLPTTLRASSEDLLRKAVMAFLDYPSLVISPATVPPVSTGRPSLTALLQPLGLHIAQRVVGVRQDSGTKFQVTKIDYDATGRVTHQSETLAGPPGLGVPGAPGLPSPPPAWPKVHKPVYVSGSF